MLKVISEIKKLILVKKFNEGLEVYHCLSCGHNSSKPKHKLLKDFKCFYCGQEA